MDQHQGELRVAILCAAVLVLEGYDLGAMAFTVPALSDAWHMKPASFTAALAAGNVGLFLGSLFCGWLGDRIGRKPVLMGCVVLFGIMSLATILADTVNMLVLFRFFTGLGIGGGIPTSIALLSDFSPAKRQGGMVMAMTCGVPAGNVLGGVVAARLLAPYGWQGVFVVGGLLPLLLLPVLTLLLPESTALRSRTIKAENNAIAQLFAPGLGRITLLLWLINFLSLLTIYFINSWLPSLLHDMGIATGTAILVAVMFQVGSIVGGLGTGVLVNRYGTERVIACMLAMGGCWLLLLGLTQVSVTLLAAFIFGAGLGVSAAQLGINALPGAIYPPAIRNTGTGWALGVGRLGNIGGPLLGGYFLAQHWTPRHMFLAIAVPAFLLALMLLVLRRAREIKA